MKNKEVAVFAGGCFWCTEAVFNRLKGVISTTSGYAGGKMENPSYEDISTGDTGYTEAVKIEFNPKIIFFDKLLKIFWTIFDPTTKNRQGNDIGTQYRSVIFYTNKDQKNEAEQSIKEIIRLKIYKNPIVTEVLPLNKFYRAEEYHQNYYKNNRMVNPYCRFVIDPKIKKLIEHFNKDVKEEYKNG